MKMEVVHLSTNKHKVLLLFDFDRDEPSPEDEQVDDYLHDHELEPKRQYRETRDGKNYLVYYFGHCYLDGHLDQLAALASEAPREELQRLGEETPAADRTYAH